MKTEMDELAIFDSVDKPKKDADHLYEDLNRDSIAIDNGEEEREEFMLRILRKFTEE